MARMLKFLCQEVLSWLRISFVWNVDRNVDILWKPKLLKKSFFFFLCLVYCLFSCHLKRVVGRNPEQRVKAAYPDYLEFQADRRSLHLMKHSCCDTVPDLLQACLIFGPVTEAECCHPVHPVNQTQATCCAAGLAFTQVDVGNEVLKGLLCINRASCLCVEY